MNYPKLVIICPKEPDLSNKWMSHSCKNNKKKLIYTEINISIQNLLIANLTYLLFTLSIQGNCQLEGMV